MAVTGAADQVDTCWLPAARAAVRLSIGFCHLQPGSWPDGHGGSYPVDLTVWKHPWLLLFHATPFFLPFPHHPYVKAKAGTVFLLPSGGPLHDQSQPCSNHSLPPLYFLLASMCLFMFPFVIPPPCTASSPPLITNHRAWLGTHPAQLLPTKGPSEAPHLPGGPHWPETGIWGCLHLAFPSHMWPLPTSSCCLYPAQVFSPMKLSFISICVHLLLGGPPLAMQYTGGLSSAAVER